MNHIDFAPLYRSTVGFDRLFDMLDSVPGFDAGPTAYPPYNIERLSDNEYQITSVSLLRNACGPGSITPASFNPGVDLPVPGRAFFVSLGDLDGDGKPEVAVAHDGGLSLFRNLTGAGTWTAESFGPSVELPTGGTAYDVAMGDLDGDGKLDLAVTTLDSPGVSVFQNRTSGGTLDSASFGSKLDFAGSANSVVISDLDGDGQADLVTARNPYLSVYRNTTEVNSEEGGGTGNVKRTLSVLSPPNRKPGDLVEVPIQLASSGDVGGMTFLLHYDPDYLSVPEVSWDAAVAGALRQVNIPSLGQIRMVFALPATTVPAGAQTLATVSFRARTVLADSTTALRLQIVDAALPTGEPSLHGTGVVPGGATILARSASPGDNNGNDHIDIGDVTLLLRLLAQMDSIRPWDIPRNDLNQNGLLDSGDVIKMLRAASAIDALPPPPDAALEPGAEATPAAGTPLPGPVAMLTPSRSGGTEGQLVTVQVRLQGLLKPISGVTFTLQYPVAALRLTGPQSHRTGPVVPEDAVVIWNVSPAQNNYATQDGLVTLAVSTPTPWPADGVLAELTFAVQPGAAAQHLWPLTLTGVEATGNGFDPRRVLSVSSVFIGRKPLPGLLGNLPKLLSGECHLTLSGDAGATYRIEASDDLLHWTTLTDLVNRTGSMSFSDTEAAHHPKRFYRTRPVE